MPQPRTLGATPHYSPAEALRMLYARLQGIRDPPAIGAALVAVLAEILGGPPVGLLLRDSKQGDYRLTAGAGVSPEALGTTRLPAQSLPPELSAAPAGNGAGPAAGAPIRLPRALPDLGALAPGVAVPLRDGERLMGLLLAGPRPDRRPYTGADLALLELLAPPMEAALREATLTEEHARSVQQLQVLHQLGEDLSANLDIETVCQTVYEQLQNVLDFDSFFVARYDEERQLLTFPFCTDEGQRYFIEPQPLGSNLSGWIFTHGRPIVVDDLTQGLEHLGIPYRPDPYGTARRSRSWMGVPMLARHRIIGVLSVHAYRPNLYRAEQLQFLSTVANQVAGALENARQLRQTDTALAVRVAQLSALEEIARLLNASLDLNRIINLVVAHAVQTTGATAGIMALFDPAQQALRLLGHIGYPPEVIEEYIREPLPINRGLIGRAVREDRSLLVREVGKDPDYIGVMPEVQSQLVMLVRRGAQVLGALSLESEDRTGFTEEHVEFVEHLAEHAALAVENARRYERERRQNETLTRRAGELAAILRISNALKADLPLDEVLTQICEGVRNSLGFNVAVLSLLDKGPPPTFVRVAAAGLDSATWEKLKASRTSLEETYRLMDPRFQVSQSYFISHLYNLTAQLPSYYRTGAGERDSREWHPDDTLLVPLRGKGGQLGGLLSVDDPIDRRLPTRATIETLEIFANQATVAIENARLFSEQRRRLEELALLQELSVGLTATLDPMELLYEVARSAVKLFDVHAGMVVLLEDPLNPRAGAGAVVCERQGDTLDTHPYPMDRVATLTAEVVVRPGPLVIPDIGEGQAVGAALERAGLQALLGMPLRAGAQTQGALYLLDDHPRTFSQPDQQLLQIFANQAAVAIQNARLFEEEVHRLRDMTALQILGLSLTANLDSKTLLEEIARLAVRLLNAASSDVLLVDETCSSGTTVRCWRDADGGLQIRRYESQVRPGGITESVIQSGQPLMVADSQNDPRANPLAIEEGIRSFVAVPIRMTDQILGVLFVNEHHPRAFATHEQQLLQIFANQVAVAIKNARLFEERRAFEQRLVEENERMVIELITARLTQRQLLPDMPRHLADLSIHGLCLPAMEVGGDYFDVLSLTDGRVALAIGDVTGKGTSAVMLMAMIKTALLSQMTSDPEPTAVIETLGSLVSEFMQGRFMTFFYAVYDPPTRQLTYANAGHLYPYIRRADSTLESLGPSSLPLGIPAIRKITAHTTTLAPGDLLVMFSDGIVEAVDADGHLFSFERLETLLREADPQTDPRLLVEDILDRVHAFAGGTPQDDATLLIARAE